MYSMSLALTMATLLAGRRVAATPARGVGAGLYRGGVAGAAHPLLRRLRAAGAEPLRPDAGDLRAAHVRRSRRRGSCGRCSSACSTCPGWPVRRASSAATAATATRPVLLPWWSARSASLPWVKHARAAAAAVGWRGCAAPAGRRAASVAGHGGRPSQSLAAGALPGGAGAGDLAQRAERPIFNERYLVASAPPFYLLIAAAFDGRRFSRAARSRHERLSSWRCWWSVVLACSSRSAAITRTRPTARRAAGASWPRPSSGWAPALPDDQVRIAQNFPDPTLWYYYRGPVEHVVLPPAAARSRRRARRRWRRWPRPACAA